MDKPKVLVGCPIFERAWILPKWLDALAAETANVDLHVFFCMTQGKDKTGEIILQETTRGRFPVSTIPFEGGIEDHSRNWTDEERVKTIAAKRNKLLEAVASVPHDYFLMLDSDVIVSPGGVASLIDTIKFDGFDAVCPRVWVWNAFYVAGRYEKGRVALLPRRERGVHAVDVVTSSACMMVSRLSQDPAVRYGAAVRGRDFGWAPGHEVNGWNVSECIWWSKQAKAKTYRLGVNCNMTFDHRMTPAKI